MKPITEETFSFELSDEDRKILEWLGGLSDNQIEKIEWIMALPDPAIEKIININSAIAKRVMS